MAEKFGEGAGRGSPRTASLAIDEWLALLVMHVAEE
jgi:hypothetical protein